MRIVLQLAWLLDAVVECLAFRRVGVSLAGLEEVAPLLGQRDRGGIAAESNGLNESSVAEMPQLAMARVEGLIELVAEVARENDAEGPTVLSVRVSEPRSV